MSWASLFDLALTEASSTSRSDEDDETWSFLTAWCECAGADDGGAGRGGFFFKDGLSPDSLVGDTGEEKSKVTAS